MTALEEALKYRCTKCQAKAGEPCLYLMPIAVGRYVYSKKQQELVDRVGTPTKRPHNERLIKVYEAKRRADAAVWRAKQEERLRDPLAAERRAYALAARQEQEDLRTWLRRYGRVLWEVR